MQPTFFFYDLETSGLKPRDDRIMQFAGQRTNLSLEPLGDPVNILVKTASDTLPSPQAIMVTKITPQSTQQDGLTEAELCQYLTSEVFTPATCAVGFNSARFDDEFIRYLFWRNFRDPYEWQWKDDRSHWDILDVVRLTRALRPEGINWPVREDGAATNRLELITKLNGLKHEHAHDALSDVYATIAVAKLIKEKQPQLFDYLYNMRGKHEVQKLVNLENPRPFVYASGRYENEFNKTTVAYPLAPAAHGRVLVFDLRYNLDELLKEQEVEKDKEFTESEVVVENVDATDANSDQITDNSDNFGQSVNNSKNPDSFKDDNSKNNNSTFQKNPFFPHVKPLAYNKCPAVAPLGVLNKDNGWEKIGLQPEQIRDNLKILLAHPDFAEQMRTLEESRPEWPAAIDAESALYDGFLSDSDRTKCAVIAGANANQLADLHPDFADDRLSGLLLHYKARNYPESLTESERQDWETYRRARLTRQAPAFLSSLQTLAALETADDFVVEELSLWFQSLTQGDDY